MLNSTSSKKELARRIYLEMWNKGNPAYANQIFSRPEGVESFVSQFLASFPDLHHSVEDIIEEGDQVVVRFSARGTHLGDWMDISATGKTIHYSGVTWARISGKKIVEHHTWWDKTGLLEQLAGWPLRE